MIPDTDSNPSEAERTFDWVNKIIKRLVVIFAIFLFAVLMFLVFEIITVQNTMARNQIINQQSSNARSKNYTDQNIKQHEVTQKYVRCIAQVLLLPIASRTDADFDQCSTPPQ